MIYIGGKGMVYVTKEISALWVDVIYNMNDHIFDVTCYPIIKDKSDIRHVLDYPMFKKKIPCFYNHTYEIDDMMDDLFRDRSDVDPHGDMFESYTEGDTIRVVHEGDMFKIYTNKKESPIITGYRDIKDRVTTCFSSSGHMEKINIRMSEGSSLAFAITE